MPNTFNSLIDFIFPFFQGIERPPSGRVRQKRYLVGGLLIFGGVK